LTSCTTERRFEVYLKGTGAPVRVRVDGQLVGTGATFTTAADGSTYFVPVTFGSSALRRITLEFSAAAWWGGIQINPTDSLWKAAAKGPRVVVMGDSFTEGTGATIPQQWWSRKMAEALGWYDVAQSGVGSTGYLAPGTGGKVKFRDRVTNDVINLNPDIVIVAGGINDSSSYTAAAIQTEAAALFAAIQAGVPKRHDYCGVAVLDQGRRRHGRVGVGYA
jgi:GDSL-like Lipase/Acylhydrolase family